MTQTGYLRSLQFDRNLVFAILKGYRLKKQFEVIEVSFLLRCSDCVCACACVCVNANVSET